MPDARIQIHQFACLSDNYGFLVRDTATGRTATIDTPDADAILAEAARVSWTITDIWNTHWHPDHAGGNAAIVAATGAQVTGPAEVARIAAMPDVLAVPGQTVALGELVAGVLDVGGHTLEHVAYHFAEEAVAFVGDALFALGCGRLFEGTAEQAHAGLERLMALPDDTKVYCAHEYTQANARFCESLGTGGAALAGRIASIDTARAAGKPTVPTSIGLERATNPFVLADEPGLRAALAMPQASRTELFAEVRRRKDVYR